VLASRALRPYPPGHLKINGVPWPSGSISSPAVVTWVPRTRLASTIVLQDAAAATPEVGTSYVVEVLDPSGEVVETQATAGLTATLASSGTVTVAVWSVRDGLWSFKAQRATVSLPGVPTGRARLSGLAPAAVVTVVSPVVAPASGVLGLTGQIPI
jgi:hypothetical protein